MKTINSLLENKIPFEYFLTTIQLWLKFFIAESFENVVDKLENGGHTIIFSFFHSIKNTALEGHQN